MEKHVYLTKSAVFFPNSPVSNEDMENYLGLINGRPSRVKNIVLRQNGITRRYYALDTNQKITHTNAELAAASIRNLFDPDFTADDMELLTCATTSPDQFLPSQASMVHGLLKNKPMEIYSASGICLCCLQAFKTAYLAIASGDKNNAVCSTSETISGTLLSKNYDEEYERCSAVNENPYMGFEKDFLRFMLSDGASAVLLENRPRQTLSFRVEAVDMLSYANKLPTCMFMGAERRDDGELKSWKEFEGREWTERSVFAVKQDIKLLKDFVVKCFADFTEYFLQKNRIDPASVRYVIPHISSMFFYDRLAEEFKGRQLDLGTEKWFTNLTWVGNIASAAIFAGLDELVRTKPIEKGDTILLLVPESGRFSYGAILLTAV